MVLAGGAGTRIGGDKATADLLGRPLIAWSLAALRGGALADVVVVAKGDTVLPDDVDAPVWREPDEPRHPLAGIVHALRTSGGRVVVVCGVDLPCVTGTTIRALANIPVPGAVLAQGTDGRPQPLLARYPASALSALAAALPQEGPLTTAALALGPALIEVSDDELRNVNTPEQLAAAAIWLERRERKAGRRG